MSSISAGTTSTTTLIHSGDTTGSLVFKTNDTGSGGTTAVTIDTSQNVGIGTTSPSQKLDVVGTARVANTTGNKYLLVGQSTPSANDGSSLEFQNSNSQKNWAIRSNWNVGGALEFCPSSSSGGTSYTTPSVVIDSSGKVMINTTSPIAGDGAYLNSAMGGSGLAFAFSTSGTGTTQLGRFYSNTSTNVGNISVTASATAYNTSSDYRLKENIAPMTGALGKVALLKPCTYQWKVDGSAGQGFIAHELQEVIPGCVTGAKDAVETYIDEDGNEATRPAYQGIDTSFLVATLTAALQETKALIDTQAETINALTARVVALEGK